MNRNLTEGFSLRIMSLIDSREYNAESLKNDLAFLVQDIYRREEEIKTYGSVNNVPASVEMEVCFLSKLRDELIRKQHFLHDDFSELKTSLLTLNEQYERYFK